MHLSDLLATNPTTFSFEFFPPRSAEASEHLYQTIRELELLRPSFVSVTYGAGGSTRQLTHDLVLRIKATTELTTIPHLTCVRHSEGEIQQILELYASHRISNILALAGDPPANAPGYDRATDAFRYAADLVCFIRRFNDGGGHDDPRGFGVGVAGFPEGHLATPNRLLEMDYLKAKVDAGADYICTQLFFHNPDFYDFRQRCELAGINVPILAGIMPITSRRGMVRMAELAAGVHFPASLLRAIERCDNDPEAVKHVGVHWAPEQCRHLLAHQLRGLHFYTLNRSHATLQIYQHLGVRDSLSLQCY